MKKSNKITGNIGENLAAEYLQKQGYNIIERNWRYSRNGEIDIIAEDKKTLVFVEVKTRKSVNFGHPLEAIDEKKFFQVKTIAQIYIAQAEKKYANYRIDAISIILSNPPEIKHLKNIF